MNPTTTTGNVNKRCHPLPRAPIGLANRACKATDGSRGIVVWIALLFAASQLRLAALFCLFNSCCQIVAIRRFRSIRVIFRPQGFQHHLYLVPVARSIVVSLVQDQPEFETRIGTANMDAIALAERNRLVETRMLVAVEHRPDLVPFLERILFSAAPPRKPQSPSVLDSFRCDGEGNPHTRTGFHSNQCAGTGTSDRVEIRRLRVPAFAEEHETPPRFTARSAPPQVRGTAPSVSISACQEPKPGRRTVPHRSGLEDTPSRSYPPCESGYRSTGRAELLRRCPSA